jgi:CheY-like chemotaxis protein
VLSVRDDGQGMDPETRRRIFEPFFTTKPGDRGTGIGLATVYGIVRQHGGAIEVRSEPGRGSTFEVYWPMAEGAGAEAAAAPAEAGAPMPRGSETLLLVEDEAKVREPTRALLERLGYRVLAAGSGAEALAAAAAHPGRIDLVVTDVVMPQMNGAELTARLRAARPGTRVLFMSGYDDRILARHGFDESSVELLPKPFTAEVLAARVRSMLDATPAGRA